MKVTTVTDLTKLALVGGLVYVGYRAVKGLGEVPNATEVATNAYWGSSLGDLTGHALDWYTNGWGSYGDYAQPLTTIEGVQDHFDRGGFATL